MVVIMAHNNIMDEKSVGEIYQTYVSIRPRIISRLNEFKQLWERGNDEEIFAELVFCLLTPQSKANLCWIGVENLVRKNLLFKNNVNEVVNELNGVRFKYKKAKYIIETGKYFINNGKITIKEKIDKFKSINELRDWLVKNVMGLGYKEASHFLRNIGLGENLAILDRHILKNLHLLGLIDEIPNSLSQKRYFEIESKMIKFAAKINIPMSHLDLLLWYKETGEIFK